MYSSKDSVNSLQPPSSDDNEQFNPHAGLGARAAMSPRWRVVKRSSRLLFVMGTVAFVIGVVATVCGFSDDGTTSSSSRYMLMLQVSEAMTDRSTV